MFSLQNLTVFYTFAEVWVNAWNIGNGYNCDVVGTGDY